MSNGFVMYFSMQFTGADPELNCDSSDHLENGCEMANIGSVLCTADLL